MLRVVLRCCIVRCRIVIIDCVWYCVVLACVRACCCCIAVRRFVLVMLLSDDRLFNVAGYVLTSMVRCVGCLLLRAVVRVVSVLVGVSMRCVCCVCVVI